MDTIKNKKYDEILINNNIDSKNKINKEKKQQQQMKKQD